AVHFDEGAAITQQNKIFEIGDLSCLYFRGQIFGDDQQKVNTEPCHSYRTLKKKYNKCWRPLA
ncbi:hypothetical protein, partial [Kaarinaea lacus]